MRNYGQTKCRWCRHGLRACAADGCLSPECKTELLEYVAANGRKWRAKLSDEWLRGSVVLRELRNVVGPSGLAGVKPVRFTPEAEAILKKEN